MAKTNEERAKERKVNVERAKKLKNQGLSTNQIAERLGVSIRTARRMVIEK